MTTTTSTSTAPASAASQAQSLLRNVRSNLVQSIRAFHVYELQQAAVALGYHFLYANLSQAQTKQDILDAIALQFTLPAHFGKNFDALYDCITDPLHKAGPQPGFIVVLEQIPTNSRFDKEVREQLLDIFRDAAEYWGERKIAFRCFYSFSVARTTCQGAATAQRTTRSSSADAEHSAAEEKLPTDKLVDVSPLALRMSSPFNAHYWLAASSDDCANS